LIPAIVPAIVAAIVAVIVAVMPHPVHGGGPHWCHGR
jgi:hypothetical protein